MARENRRGQSLIESTIVLLALCALVFGSLDAALLARATNFVPFAAGEGARYAMLHGHDPEEVRNYVLNLATGIPNPGNIAVETVWSTDPAAGGTVKVTVTYSYQPMLLATAATIPISSQSQLALPSDLQ
jgi:Flp pilus assembly protein TadG